VVSFLSTSTSTLISTLTVSFFGDRFNVASVISTFTDASIGLENVDIRIDATLCCRQFVIVVVVACRSNNFCRTSK
jgi:hypothetical protein